jgi:hypothetical protein
MPKPLVLLARFALTLSLLLGLAFSVQQSLLLGLVPLIKAAVQFVLPDFHVVGVDVVTNGHGQVLRLLARLNEPQHINDHWIYPQGWLGAPSGSQQVSAFQVDLTSGGTLSYSLLVFTLVLAWPAKGAAIVVRRLFWALMLALLLLLVNVMTTFAAEVWALLHDVLAPREIWPLLVWSKMLMGGVGLMLSVASGALAIALAEGSPGQRVL